MEATRGVECESPPCWADSYEGGVVERVGRGRQRCGRMGGAEGGEPGGWNERWLLALWKRSVVAL